MITKNISHKESYKKLVKEFEIIYDKYFKDIDIINDLIYYSYKFNNIKYDIYIFKTLFPFYNLIMFNLLKNEYPNHSYKYTYTKNNKLTNIIYKYYLYKLYIKSYSDSKEEVKFKRK